MNAGWVFGFGEYHASTEKAALAHAKRLGYDSLNVVCYYTEWDEVDEDEWFTEGGDRIDCDDLRLVKLSLSHFLVEVTEDIALAYYLRKDLTGAQIVDLYGDLPDYDIVEQIDNIISILKKV